MSWKRSSVTQSMYWLSLTLGTVLAAPLGLAGARLRLKVELAVARAVGQTLLGRLIHGAAVQPLPALLAQALALRTKAMTGARGMRTVH